jgi:hypothetical protein
MRRGAFVGDRRGGHAVVDAATCPACSHPQRLHNAYGCVRGDCDCALDRDGGQPVTEPAAAPDGALLDALDPVCGRCAHRRGRHAVLGTGLPCRDCPCKTFAEATDAAPSKAGRTPAMAAAPAGAPAVDEGPADEPPAGATARAGFGLGLKTPRRPEPRPAGEALVCPAAVGGDDADEEVAADHGAPAATALAEIAVLVEKVLDHAYFFAARWYCPTCVSWPVSPGACVVCQTPIQPVYLATLPRSVL